VYELGLRRLRESFNLQPVEYPTTRRVGSPAKDRARDVLAAFTDPAITAVLASIGGDDQITLLRYLDPEVLRANPKPFFGYSDNTNLLNHLYRAGVVGYHGGSVMVHLGRGGQLHPAHADSLRAALFTSGWYELTPPADWGDEPGNWNDPGCVEAEPSMWPHAGWDWVNADRILSGPTWGGNLEIVSWLLQAGFVSPNAQFAGHILVLETSEEMPAAEEVYRILRNMGERGLLEQFVGLVMGRPKSWEQSRPNNPDEKRKYHDDQRAAVLRAMTEYNPTAMMVLDVDLGHTDPQLIVPYGGDIKLDGVARRIHVHY